MRIPVLLLLLGVAGCAYISTDTARSGVPTAPISAGPQGQFLSGDVDPQRGVTFGPGFRR